MRTLKTIPVLGKRIYWEANGVFMDAINSLPKKVRAREKVYKFFGRNHKTGEYVFLVMEDKGAWFESVNFISGSYPSDDDAPRHAMEAAYAMGITEFELCI